MRLASVAKSVGSESILPEGMNLTNMPNDLFLVMEHALRILSWQENLTSDECPPSWMWGLDWEIEAWFDKVKIDRDRKYGKTPKPGDSDFNDEGGGMFEENVYFDRVKRGEPITE